MRIAEDAALVDALSNGQLVLGVGRVWQVPEFETFQINQTQSREMYTEAIEVIHRAWTEDTFSHEEKFWQFKDVSIFQKPTPPIFWTRASSFQIMRYPSWRRSTWQRPTRRLSETQRPTRSGSTNNALSAFLPGAPGRTKPDSGYEEYPADPGAVAQAAADDLWKWGTAYGSPQTVIKKLRDYRARTFTNHWMTWMRIGELPHDKVMKSMELFAKEVMPVLREDAEAEAEVSAD